MKTLRTGLAVLFVGLVSASCGSEDTALLVQRTGGGPGTGGTPNGASTSLTSGGATVESGGTMSTGGVASSGKASGGTGAGGPANTGGTAPGTGGVAPTTGGSGPTGGIGNSGGTTGAGGASTAGKTNSGGVGAAGRSTGGSNTGGSGTGGGLTGGASSGGTSTGGTSTGGTSTGGTSTGGTSTGGQGGGASTLPKFILGADISSVDEAMDRGTQYADTDGTSKSIFDILKNHGFNFIRLRAFVKPGATYGYAYGTGGNCIKSENYCDTEHTVAFGKQVKTAGMGLLLDLHYSDNWADPGNQIIPEDWRNAGSITELASYVKTYTQDVVSAMVSAGARPDIVQIGNETTPGMLVHVPNSNTDCWGNNVSAASIGGSTSNWTNLGTLLKAGVEGVKAVDASIKIMVHIENTRSASGVVSWVRSARNQGVALDIVGLSCYVAWQGEPSVWQNTFTTLASTFSDLSFVIAEYNPERTQANQIMHDLPNGQGLGTFFWEPTQGGEWGSSMFTSSGGTMRANAADFQEFDTIAQNFGL